MGTKKAAPAAKTAPKTEAPAEAPKAAPKEEKVSLAKMRGPRGVAETAKIKLLTDGGQNPKRAGSKAHAVFGCYKTNMTVGAFCDAVDALAAGAHKGSATPNLVYDASHGFISIEGHTPAEIFVPKPKAEKEVKEPKGKAVPRTPKAAEVEKEASEETME